MPAPSDVSVDEQTAFFAALANPADLLQLFDALPEVYHYVKDTQGRYLRANRMVCRVVGVASDRELLGKTDFDFFPRAIAAQYRDEDRRVLATKSPLTDQVWLVPDSHGVPQVYLCNKMPLLNQAGEVIGIAGLKRPYRQSIDLDSHLGRLMQVIGYVTANYQSPISVADLAEQARLSKSQLHREFTGRFGITPHLYIREVRIGVARRLLEADDLSMSKIASECGFYDQSQFSRQFKLSTGQTPLKYRQRSRESAQRRSLK